MTGAADPPPGPATPDENPNRHLTRHPDTTPQVPVMPPQHEAADGPTSALSASSRDGGGSWLPGVRQRRIAEWVLDGHHVQLSLVASI